MRQTSSTAMNPLTDSLTSSFSPTLTSNAPIPMSVPEIPGRPSLCNIPAELRLEICTHLLELSNVPRSYGYTGAASPPHTPSEAVLLPQSKEKNKRSHHHAMVTVSKQLGAEYRQAFYERTRFFLRIDENNAFRAIPGIDCRNPGPGKTSAGLPDFWFAPAQLLSSLRHCTLYVEIGDIAGAATSNHSEASARVEREVSYFENADVYAIDRPLKAARERNAGSDELFDKALRGAVEDLLRHMQQLRTIQLIWETSLRDVFTNWTWDALGQPVVDLLQSRSHLRSLQVRVGWRESDQIYIAHRGEGGQWVGGFA